jgi:3-dehydroquinate dehydratase-1
MAQQEFLLTDGRTKVVGSFGGTGDLRGQDAEAARRSCDLAEIRLDLILDASGAVDAGLWRHLQGIPLLFTARRLDEGGARALSAEERSGLLESSLDQAACVDIEVASIGEMAGFLKSLEIRGIPWIASFHDFEKLPESAVLQAAARRAKDAGAGVFKAAAKLHGPADIARLAEFQLGDHGIPVATMGMGPLAPVSRLLCAQCGSLLNYGYLGKTPTAPGQWDAALLKETIARLVDFRL